MLCLALYLGFQNIGKIIEGKIDISHVVCSVNDFSGESYKQKKSLKSKIHLKELVRESKMLKKEILVEPNKKTG